jgi:hypothetical protein
MHSALYDEQHKLYKVPMTFDKLSSKRISTGEYDTKILCADCDNKISDYETYFSKILYGGYFRFPNSIPKFNKYTNQDGLIFTEVTNLNYLKSRLFLLSLLWRASVTSRPNFFDVKLPKKSENKIRDMLYNEEPGEPFEYGCSLITFLDHKNIENGIIASPRRTLDGKQFVFLIHGFYYKFYIDSQIPETVKNHILDKNGRMDILHIPEIKAIELLNNFLGATIF